MSGRFRALLSVHLNLSVVFHLARLGFFESELSGEGRKVGLNLFMEIKRGIARRGGFQGKGAGTAWSCVARISSSIFDIFSGFVAVGVLWVCATRNEVGWILAGFFDLSFFPPIEVKRAESDPACSPKGLFGVHGRAAELGSFASDNAVEMPFASEFF